MEFRHEAKQHETIILLIFQYLQSYSIWYLSKVDLLKCIDYHILYKN